MRLRRGIGTQLMRKLRSSAGESLVEVLTAVLIGGISLLMLATALTSASSMVKSSSVAMDQYYDTSNALIDSTGKEESLSLKTTSGNIGLVKPDDTSITVTLNDEEFLNMPIVYYQRVGGAS